MPVKPSTLTPLGILIERKGLALSHVIEHSGLSRYRLAALRTMPTAVITLTEGASLAPVLGMSMEQMVEALEKISARQTAAQEPAAG